MHSCMNSLYRAAQMLREKTMVPGKRNNKNVYLENDADSLIRDACERILATLNEAASRGTRHTAYGYFMLIVSTLVTLKQQLWEIRGDTDPRGELEFRKEFFGRLSEIDQFEPAKEYYRTRVEGRKGNPQQCEHWILNMTAGCAFFEELKRQLPAALESLKDPC